MLNKILLILIFTSCANRVVIHTNLTNVPYKLVKKNPLNQFGELNENEFIKTNYKSFHVMGLFTKKINIAEDINKKQTNLIIESEYTISDFLISIIPFLSRRTYTVKQKKL